ncbi:hypothetical protein P168DRAFT_330185 [Aspergillus campestris IBT 28561]|uniref:MICOS complex subunit MIC12 n=1 Tax=Aspergillus campestris (strain IBT 28561) TaxID=1392248 RepID=A0A2I1CTD9_ASPC2|nr:uncharacterized protein P168DRAFT_330185 [Aspergillus campestris IBT 28561]PKY00888.1 hypothetical protein P168DRAFT_330185 [Aspergillus campestris IBT 28561]
MGFFSGFFSGFALTTTVLYLSVQVHRSNRLDQRNTIREHTRILNELASPVGAYDRRLAPKDRDLRAVTDQPAQTPPSRPTVQAMFKHRWNQEVEKLARRAYESRWEDARDAAAEGWKNVVRLVKKE